MEIHFDAASRNGVTLGELAEFVSRMYSAGGQDETLVRFSSNGAFPTFKSPGLYARRLYAELPDKNDK